MYLANMHLLLLIAALSKSVPAPGFQGRIVLLGTQTGILGKGTYLL